MIKKWAIILFIGIGFSCANKDNRNQVAVNLKVNDCFDNYQNQVRICLDSIFNDSRCPTGFECVWGGDALATFTLTKNKVVRNFNLHANNRFQSDTLIDGITIKLIKISPYPVANQQINTSDYIAEIIVNTN